MRVAAFDLAAYLGERAPAARASDPTGEWCLPCPRCGGREHLYVNVEKRCGHCFRCDWSPGLIDFLAELEGRPRTEIARRIGARDEAAAPSNLASLRDRVRALGARAILPLPSASPIPLPEAYIPLAPRHSEPTEHALAPFRAYLAKRRISPTAVGEHRIGCALLGRYAGRVVFPVLAGTAVVAYQARDITGRSRLKYFGPEGQQLGRVLFNLDRAREHDRIVVCEGIISALCAGTDAVASFGKTLKPRQVALLAAAGRPVVVLFDAAKAATGAGDADREAEEAASRLHRAGVQAFVARLEHGDPADNAPEVVRRAIDRAAPFDSLFGLRRRLLARPDDWAGR